MRDFLPCICGEDAELDFDGGWLFKCHECYLVSEAAFSPQAARKSWRILVAKMEADE